MFADFYTVRKQLFKLTDLYTKSPASIYYYTRGFNWRAPIAWIMGIWFTLPGFARQVQGGEPLVGWSDLYYMSWPLGTRVSMLTYYILYRLAPFAEIGEVDNADYFELGDMDQAELVDGVSGSEDGREVVLPEKIMEA